MHLNHHSGISMAHEMEKVFKEMKTKELRTRKSETNASSIIRLLYEIKSSTYIYSIILFTRTHFDYFL